MASRKPLQDSAEDRLIARHFRPLATHPGALGLSDDAAVLAVPPAHELVLTTDAVVAGVHFLSGDPADVVARRALRVNLSDLAGKGAKPLGFLLSLALSKDIGDRWLRKFAAGLRADAKKFGCPLLGGDTDRTPGLLSVTVCAFGTVPRGAMVLRDGAKPGDHVMVTGTIGDAALGLMLRQDAGAARRWGLDSRMRDHLLRRYGRPEPRNAIAVALRRYAHGGMDVSDGLAGDLAKMCRAARLDAAVDVTRVPLSRAARTALAAEPALIETILTGGDDYEVLAAVPARNVERLRQAAKQAGVAITEMGRMSAGSGRAGFTDRDGRALKFVRPSFSHF